MVTVPPPVAAEEEARGDRQTEPGNRQDHAEPYEAVIIGHEAPFQRAKPQSVSKKKQRCHPALADIEPSRLGKLAPRRGLGGEGADKPHDHGYDPGRADKSLWIGMHGLNLPKERHYSKVWIAVNGELFIITVCAALAMRGLRVLR